jgi:adenylate cyclase
LEALKHAAIIAPECGQVWTILGCLYGQIYSLDLPGFENTLGKAATYAEKGVQLNPNKQQARGARAFIRIRCNEIPAALSELEHAVALNLNSLFMLDSIDYFMTLLGEWERGPALIRKGIKLNPYYANHVHYALWVNWLRQEKYEAAYLKTQNLKKPALFWDHLAKAQMRN